MRRVSFFKLQRRNVQTILIAIGLLLFLFLFPSPRRTLEAPLRDIWHVAVTLRGLFAFAGSDTRELYNRLTTLERQVSATAEQQAQLAEAQAQVAELRSELDLKDPKNAFARVSANVLTVSEPGHAWRMHIDVGSERGVREGMAVVVGEGTMIGVIDEVREGRSVVKLLADQNTKIPVMFLGSERTRGVLLGDGGERYKLTLIPREASPSPDMVIVTSGLDGTLPRGLVVGSIDAVADDPRDPFLTADVRPVIDPRTLRVVSVMFEKI